MRDAELRLPGPAHVCVAGSAHDMAASPERERGHAACWARSIGAASRFARARTPGGMAGSARQVHDEDALEHAEAGRVAHPAYRAVVDDGQVQARQTRPTVFWFGG